jgi:hypothetical protein
MNRTVQYLSRRLKVLFIFLVVIYMVAGISLYLLQDKIIFLGVPLADSYQFQFDTPFVEHHIAMEDGGIINVLHFKSDSSKGLIVYYHGNAGNLSGWGMVAEDLASYGYDVVMMDYRGYGKSIGKRSQATLLGDAIKVYDFFKDSVAERKVIIFGRSIGTGMATHVASLRKPSKLILESPFYNFTSLVQSIIPIFPAKLTLKYRFPNDGNLQQVSCPVIIFHGNKDEVVPYEQGRRLYEGTQNVKMFTIDGGGHNNLGQFESYRMALRKELE